jgi:hypothetical protein
MSLTEGRLYVEKNFAGVQPKSSDVDSNNPAGIIANWNQPEPAQTQICRK